MKNRVSPIVEESLGFFRAAGKLELLVMLEWLVIGQVRITGQVKMTDQRRKWLLKLGQLTYLQVRQLANFIPTHKQNDQKYTIPIDLELCKLSYATIL